MDRLNHLFRRLPVWSVYVLGAVPALWLLAATLANTLGPDPVRAIEHDLGFWALRFLLAALAISPLRRLGLNLLRFRRALGLLAFYYAALHLTVWLGLDMGLRFSEIAADLVKRPYVILGMLGFLTMLPLALTSTNAAIRRMGPAAWTRLHRLAYVATAAGVAHLALVSKVWTAEILIYAAIAALLLGWRLRRTPARRAVSV